MSTRSISKNIAPVNMIDPVNQTINNTTVAGAGCDLQGYESATVIAQVGAWGDTVSGGMIEFAVQESDDNSTFTDVANANLTDTIAGASTVTGAAATGVFGKVSSTSNDQTTFRTGYVGSKRYIRIKMNGEKNLATGSPIAVLLVKGNPDLAPTA